MVSKSFSDDGNFTRDKSIGSGAPVAVGAAGAAAGAPAAYRFSALFAGGTAVLLVLHLLQHLFEVVARRILHRRDTCL